MFGDKLFDCHWLASANLLNKVVRPSKNSVVIIDADFMQMLNEVWIRLFPDQFDELLTSHLLVLNLFPEDPTDNRCDFRMR